MYEQGGGSREKKKIRIFYLAENFEEFYQHSIPSLKANQLGKGKEQCQNLGKFSIRVLNNLSAYYGYVIVIHAQFFIKSNVFTHKY